MARSKDVNEVIIDAEESMVDEKVIPSTEELIARLEENNRMMAEMAKQLAASNASQPTVQVMNEVSKRQVKMRIIHPEEVVDLKLLRHDPKSLSGDINGK